MTPIEQSGQFERRGQVDRRRGYDARPPEEILSQGERRKGLDRRARDKRKSERFGAIGHNLLYAVICAIVFCFVDIRFFDGRHSMRVAIEWGEYASSVADRWVGGGFAR